MNITIQTHHVDITDAIRDYVHKKMQKLETFAKDIQDIIVDLDIEGNYSDENDRQLVSVHVKCKGSSIHAREASKDIYASVDMVFSKLEKQLVKYTQKRQKLHRDHQKRSVDLKDHEPEDGADFVESDPHYIPKPMYPEDALSHLEARQLSFLMFRNASTEDINVIYNDGDTAVVLEP